MAKYQQLWLTEFHFKKTVEQFLLECYKDIDILISQLNVKFDSIFTV